MENNQPIKEDEWIEKFRDITWSSDIPYESEANYLTAKACFEIAKQYAASIQDNNSAGVWVKASERLPDKYDSIPVRTDSGFVSHGFYDGKVFWLSDSYKRKTFFTISEIEWLDESQSNKSASIQAAKVGGYLAGTVCNQVPSIQGSKVSDENYVNNLFYFKR